MTVDYRTVFQALADRLDEELVGKGVARAVTRKNLPASAFPPKQQPAICVVESSGRKTDEDAIQDLGGPEVLEAYLVVHSRVGGEDESPGDRVLEIVRAIHDALKWKTTEPRGPSGSAWTTLGGAVYWARVGDWFTVDSDEDVAQVSTQITVTMLAVPSAE